MEEVVEEAQPVQTAAGLYTGCSALSVTPEVLGPFSNIFRIISERSQKGTVFSRRENSPLQERNLLSSGCCGLDWGHSYHCKPVQEQFK